MSLVRLLIIEMFRLYIVDRLNMIDRYGFVRLDIVIIMISI